MTNRNIFRLFAGAGVIAALASCSNEEPIGGSGSDEGAVGNRYLSVNIVSAPSNSTRASGTQTPGDPNGGAIYEEGTENQVQSVRFYFFDSNGNAQAVKKNGTNYYDWSPRPDAGEPDMPNVEKKLNAVVVINTEDGDELPAKMLAVVNPQWPGEQEGEFADLATIRDKQMSLAQLTGKSGSKDTGFLMTNSVYALGSTAVEATTIGPESYQTSSDLAIANPVNVYVERSVAKVRVRFDHGNDSKLEYETIGGPMSGGYQAIVLKDKDNNPIKIDGKQVYLRVYGWEVTAETDKGYFGKHIDPSWKADLFGKSEPWNWDPYFRSFWGINAPEAKQVWKTYNDAKTSKKDFATGVAYTNENAPQTPATKSTAGAALKPYTKVLIAGELIDINGDAFEICKYAGLTIVGKDNLKTSILDQLQANGNIYSVTTDGIADTEGNVTVSAYTELTAGDVEFKTAFVTPGSGVAGEEDDKGGRYYVYLQLTDDAAKKTWSTSNANKQPSGKLMNGVAANKYLLGQVGPAQIYKDGMTYYSFPLRHLGSEGNVGFYGAVRNHIYDCTIENLTGLGTPVYNPGENIYPEKPKDEQSYIAARINILSWRVVPNKVELDW